MRSHLILSAFLLFSACGQAQCAVQSRHQRPSPEELRTEEITTTVAFLSTRPKILKENIFDEQLTDLALNASYYKRTFLIPVFCSLASVKTDDVGMYTSPPPNFFYYPATRALLSYGKEALPRAIDVYASTKSAQPQKGITEQESIFSLISYIRDTGDPVQNSVFFRQQGDLYRIYANRMQILSERVERYTAPSYPAPALDTRPEAERLRRACEILIALEEGQTKPLSAAEEASLVKELGTLQQDFSASTLVQYLAKPVVGLDKAQVKSALLALGEPAVPEVLRFLRADRRSPEELQEALPLLIALCKSPEAAKERLQQTAKTYEDGAKLFDEKAALFLP